MALAILTAEKLESGETNNESTSFFTNTIRTLFKKQETEIEYNNSLKQFSLEEVKNHDSWNDCWVIIYDRVYDITQFLHQVSRNSISKSLSAPKRASNFEEFKEFQNLHSCALLSSNV
jgi:cytochrome b involved in lipid metabolism